MKIRAITSFAELGTSDDAATLQQLAAATQAAQSAIEAAGYEPVQTWRVASQSFSHLASGLKIDAALSLAQSLEAQALAAGFAYLSLGPVAAGNSQTLDMVAPILGSTEATFMSVHLANENNRIDPAFLLKIAQVIQAVSIQESAGFANLKLAALARVGPGSPFFPAAYHAGGPPAFAFAPQAADLAVDAFSGAESIAAGSQALTLSIEAHARKLEAVGEEIEAQTGIRFLGIDFSMAPHPDERESLGKAFEDMGVPRIGLQGSLSAAAILTSAIQRADFKRTGFNGLLLPPLEDAVLAQRAAEGTLSIQKLLLYSAVCGTGLDTLPLPGDASPEALAAILMDLASLGIRLDKPLTARLLPIPGKQAGERTAFDFEFFVNSRIFSLEGEGLQAPLKSSEPFSILPRHQSK